ncbi:MAG: energy transducer TonB [Gemmatimonadales bacterium]
MRAMSSAVSITMHVALGAAVLFGTAKTGRSNPTLPLSVLVVFPQPPNLEPSIGVPTSIGHPDFAYFREIPLPSIVLQTGAPSHPAFPTSVSTLTTGSALPSPGWGGGLGEAGPEVLTGPLPVYPELLRQAGVQGQVVLEAVVDTTGRVRAASLSVVSATNPGFVAPARQALLATLFRPARVGGRAVSMLVRVPFDFTIRGGTGRAR